MAKIYFEDYLRGKELDILGYDLNNLFRISLRKLLSTQVPSYSNFESFIVRLSSHQGMS